MSQKLLQKTGNKFLQLALPENLIANKRIGKRERYRTRPGAVHKNHFRMEGSFFRQWLFSWNTLKERRPQEHGKTLGTKSVHPFTLGSSGKGVTQFIELNAPFPQITWNDLHGMPWMEQPVFLVTPAFHIIGHRISRAVGGNIIQHLNQHVRGNRDSATLKSIEKDVPVAPNAIPELGDSMEIPDQKWQCSPGQSASFYRPALQIEKKKELARPDYGCTTYKEWAASGFSSSMETYRFPGNERFTAADYLGEQIKLNNFHMIHSLHEKGKAGNRPDKINDDYRNQLAEWRKIALLYGDLPKKTIVRAMHRAKTLAGDVDSNFLSLLETRLDVALKRAFFFPTLRAARQWIKCGKILVNNLPITVSGCLLQPGDFISICPSAQSNWKKQCLRTLATMGNPQKSVNEDRGIFSQNVKAENRSQPKKNVSTDVLSGNLNNPSDYQTGFANAREQWDSLKKERRFPFSPSLMRKWKEWSQLWGNSRHSSSLRTPPGKKAGRGHRWEFSPPRSFPAGTEKGAEMGFMEKAGVANPIDSTEMLLYFFSSSTFASYLSATKKSDEKVPAHIKNKETHPFPPAPGSSREHAPTCNEKERHLCAGQVSSPPSPMPLLPSFSQSNRFSLNHPLLLRPETAITDLLSGGGMIKQDIGKKGTPYSSANIFTGKTASARESNKCCQLLHKEQSYVVDGLYSLRWSKVFATKKSGLEKKHHWRWSCIKPLHLECSYKHYTFVFLYSPQKLAWPGSINVSFLRKRVGK